MLQFMSWFRSPPKAAKFEEEKYRSTALRIGEHLGKEMRPKFAFRLEFSWIWGWVPHFSLLLPARKGSLSEEFLGCGMLQVPPRMSSCTS